jgi:hypothetical protein
MIFGGGIMEPIITDVVISSDRRLYLEIKLSSDCPVGEAVVTLTVEPKSAAKPKNRISEISEIFKGQIWMSDDFDDPLDDFSEYM